jgi:isoleucyl-tRNA synthetase
VLFDIADSLLRLIAPILVHTADEAWLKLHGHGEDSGKSIHLVPLPEPLNVKSGSSWAAAMVLRDEALKALEEARTAGTITNPLDASIAAVIDPERFASVTACVAELADLCGVSRFSVSEGTDTTFEVKDLTEEPRCQRCWKRDGTVAERNGGFWLSERDADVVKNMNLEA